MKKLTSLIAGVATLGTVGVVPPLSLTIWVAERQDIILNPGVSKEMNLIAHEEEGVVDYYCTTVESLGLVFRYYTFANTEEECNRHDLRYYITNLSWSEDLIKITEGTEPSVSLQLDSWGTKDPSQTVCNGWFGHFNINNCTMDENAWKRMKEKYSKYTITEEIMDKVMEVVESTRKRSDFANARTVRNILSKLIMIQNDRTVDNLDDLNILAEDVEVYKQDYLPELLTDNKK